MNIFGFPPIKKGMIPRRGWLFSGMMLGWLCFPLWGWCESPASPAPKPESRVSPPASPQAASPSKRVEETSWLSLREVIQQFSETTGNPIRISGGLQQNDKLFNRMYLANDPSWLEDFSRIEIFNDQTGKKEIILLGKANGRSPSGPSLNTISTRNQSRKNRFRKKASEKIQQAQTKRKALTQQRALATQRALTKHNAKSKSPP